MKICVVYHRVDLDGWMSAAIVKKWFIKKYKKTGRIEEHSDAENMYPVNDNIAQLFMFGFQYGDDLPNLTKYDMVIMCDISFPADIMLELYREKGMNLIWLDHHISAIKDVDAITGLEGLPPVNGMRRTDKAACEITWNYFFNPDQYDDDKYYENMPEIVRLLGRYDCFGHSGTDEEQQVLEFQYGARAVIDNYKSAFFYLESTGFNQNGTQFLEDIFDKGEAIYKFLKLEAQAAWQHVVSGILEENGVQRVIGFINKERFNPINFGIDYHVEDYDAVVCYWYSNDNMFHCSIYNDNGKVDCSVIAKSFGGGGHKGASGFVISFKEMSKLVK